MHSVGKCILFRCIITTVCTSVIKLFNIFNFISRANIQNLAKLAQKIKLMGFNIFEMRVLILILGKIILKKRKKMWGHGGKSD